MALFQEKLSGVQVGGPSPDMLRTMIREEIQASCSGSSVDKNSRPETE